MIETQDPGSICLSGLRVGAIARCGGVRLCNRKTVDGTPFVTEESIRCDVKILEMGDQYRSTHERGVDAYLRTITRDTSAFSPRLTASDHAFDHPAFCSWEKAGCPGSVPPAEVWHEISRDVAKIIRDTDIFISREGHLVLGPKVTKVGDVICIFQGGPVPFVLRQLGGDEYLLVGECYVHGIMDGEAISNVSEDQFDRFIIR
jgi:hypothetical protein